MIARPLRSFGRLGLELGRQVGGLGLVFARSARALPRLDPRELVRSIVHFGYDALPLAVALGAFIGAILVLFANVNVQRYGAKSLLGWAAGYTVLREFGPLVTALVMTGRVGARNAAELASMSIGGQLEGLRGVGVDPFELLVAPRVIASAFAVTALGLVANLVAVVAAAWFGQLVVEVEAESFLRSFELMLTWRDVAAGVIKMVAFGATISLVSTRAGLLARGGARAVGRVAATAVVASSAVLTALDWGLTIALEGVL